MDREILEFKGYNRWLSNFWPCKVIFGGLEFNSVEAAYVAAKTVDLAIRKKVQSFETPGQCKRFGRSIELRDDWHEVKLDVMRNLLMQKFALGSPLASRLLETGDCNIVEGNTWGDTFWGVCEGVGENNLGKLIMQIREGLKPTSNRELPAVLFDGHAVWLKVNENRTPGHPHIDPMDVAAVLDAVVKLAKEDMRSVREVNSDEGM